MLKQLPNTKLNSIKFLLIGYILIITLFSVLLIMDSEIQKGQISVIDSSAKLTLKMKTIVNLIEKVRERAALSHAMISAEDVFDKDEISQQISSIGGQFIQNYRELLNMDLSSKEQDILKELTPKFEEVRQKLRKIAALALDENQPSEDKARNIIIYEIVPTQQIVTNGFMQILTHTQEKMHLSRKIALANYTANKHYRSILIVIMFIASMIIIVWVIRRLSTIENKLNMLSLMDALTGIANRRSFDKHLSMIWGSCIREQQQISLLLIDIDYFKKYNDFYGHQKGDECLTQIASIFRASTKRINDLAARYGGEEFAIILPNINKKEALNFANNLIELVNQENIPHEKSSIASHITISIGLATVVPSKNANYLELIKKADQNLYISKEHGRNQAN